MSLIFASVTAELSVSLQLLNYPILNGIWHRDFFWLKPEGKNNLVLQQKDLLTLCCVIQETIIIFNCHKNKVLFTLSRNMVKSNLNLNNG